MGEGWLARYGGKISSEWFFSKTLQILDEAPEIYAAADRLIVESPTPTGLIAIRAMAPEPGLMPVAQSAVAASRCIRQTEPARTRK